MLFASEKRVGNLYLVNKHKHVKSQVKLGRPATIDVFIGRPSCLGNKYHIGKDGTRDEVCDKYDLRLRKKVKRADPVIMAELQRISDLLDKGHDVCLVCFCDPLRCHGLSVIKQVKRLRGGKKVRP